MTHATNPLLCITRGVISHYRGQIKYLILTTGARLHPQYSFEISKVADRQNLFSLSHTCKACLVRQMECPEHWCEQNDDTTISIIALACAYVVIMDFYGVCEETRQSC